jgi:arsenic resistance protein ArsH
MRPFLPSPRYLTRLILSKAVHQMGSIVASRELRTLAQVPQLALSVAEDDAEIRAKYRPFLLDPEVEAADWISQLELDTVMSISSADIEKTGSRLKVLVLYGSLRKRYPTHILAFPFF